MPEAKIVHWEAPTPVRVPQSLSAPAEIAEFAKRLSVRERQQLAQAFDAKLYDMGASFVWTRAMAGLKGRLADLGIEFIAEILDRPDIRPGAEVHEVLTDYEAVRLAEDLGMVGGTQALRLRHSLELIAHFSTREVDDDDDDEGLSREDAINTLRVCVQSVLGYDQINVASGFAEFRRELETTLLDSKLPPLQGLENAAYFFKRTVLRTLLASSKTTRGARLETVLGNLNTILPLVWSSLKDPDRYTAGRAYAEFHADGQAKQASGVRSALLKVSGFDYVPESLRSRTFSDAAGRVIDAHFGWNNFHNEPGPMKSLASLGTSIPGPAFHRCMTAALLVRIGNRYGVSNAAQDPATALLRGVTTDRWEYFLDECLPVDDDLLRELAVEGIARRWCEMITDFPRLETAEPVEDRSRELLEAGLDGDASGVVKASKAMLKALRPN